MKYLSLLLFLLFVSSTCYAQIKHDYVWVLGDLPSQNDSAFGGTDINFNDNSVDINYANRVLDIELTNASISDSAGNLLFYTNGCFVANREHEIINNSLINPGEAHDAQCGENGDDGYTVQQGTLFLPAPGDDSTYYLLHEYLEYDWSSSFPVYINELLFTKLKVSSNDSLGVILEVNESLVKDTLTYGAMTAVKHANNKDWWIIEQKIMSNKYYAVLLTENGFEGPFEQEIGLPIDLFGEATGQAVFSPDGQ